MAAAGRMANSAAAYGWYGHGCAGTRLWCQATCVSILLVDIFVISLCLLVHLDFFFFTS